MIKQILIIFVGAFTLCGINVNAGVLLTNANQTQVGNLVESDASISLQTEYGAVDFKKQNLAWYSVSKDIDSLYKAAQQADVEGKKQISARLFELSAKTEPANRAAAEHALELIKIANIKTSDLTSGSDNFEAMQNMDPASAEEKMKEGQRLIESGNNILSQTMLKGSSQESNRVLAQKNIEEGKRLVAEAQTALESIRKQQEAEALATQQVVEQKKVEEEKAQVIKQERLELMKPVEWTDTEKYVNYGTVAAFMLIVFFSLWQITMGDVKK